MRLRPALLAVALLGCASSARADAIGTPACLPGARGVRHPGHGTGWCEPAPCETDADCSPARASVWSRVEAGPRVCREVGLCVWGDRGDAIGACEVDGAPCSARPYSGEGTCRVRGHCVAAPPASIAPPPPPPDPPAPEPPAEPPAEPVTPRGCSVAPAHGNPPMLLLTLATALALRVARRGG